MGEANTLPNHEENTKILAFHLYPEDYKKLMEICRKGKRFHSEVLRELVQDFIKKHEQQPQKQESQEEKSDLEQYLGSLSN